MRVCVIVPIVVLWLVASPVIGAAAGVSDRIANGADAELDRYRWFGLVGTGAKKFDKSCAGALIAPDFFLMSRTPTSCKRVDISESFNVKVGVNCLDRSDKSCAVNATALEVGEVESRFSSVFRRADFEFPSTGTSADQLTLVQFSSPITGITPAVPDDGTGFALLGPAAAVVAVTAGKKSKQYKQLKTVPTSKCKRDYIRLALEELPSDFGDNDTFAFCTENVGGGFCFESGVSLILPGAASNGADLLVGMYEQLSSSDCARSNLPNVSVRLSTSFDWIKTVVCVRSVEPPFWCQEGAATVTCPTERGANTFKTPMQKSCRWLSKNPMATIHTLCKDLTIAGSCPVTCASCPTPDERRKEKKEKEEKKKKRKEEKKKKRKEEEKKKRKQERKKKKEAEGKQPPNVEIQPSGPEVPTPSPTVSLTPTRDFSAEREFLAKFTPVELLETPGTPQHKALLWLSHDDQLDHAVVNDLHYLERYAMTVLYFATAAADDHPEVTRTGPGWFDEEKMLDPNLDTCEWHRGIVCREHGGTLVMESIDFSRSGLAGTLPPEIGLFAGLHTLRLTKNEVHGTLPSKIGNLKNLETLELGLNLFEGILPPELGQLTQLLHLRVTQNKFVGSLPDAFFNFVVHLRTLDVSYNNLEGTLSSGVGNMGFLRALDLRNNKFGGTMPTSLTTLVELAFLNVDDNRFSGSLFLTSDFLSHHEEVTASHNLFTGTIPGLHSSGVSDDVDNPNRLEGVVVEEKLRVLDLSFNRFHGSISGGIGHIPNVRVVNLRHNNLEGHLPTNLSTSVQSLEYINLSENRLTGTIPPLGNTERTHFIDLHSNQLTGGIPAHLFLPNLVYLDVSDNGRLGGRLPTEAIGGSKLRYFKARGVGLTGPFESSFFGSFGKLETLDLGHNLMKETIPTKLGLLTFLFELRLDNNKFVGTLPSEIGQLTRARIIDVHRNSLGGTVPEEILNCVELEELLIYNNNFTGPLPDTICSALPDLQSLVVDDTLNCTCCDVRLPQPFLGETP